MVQDRTTCDNHLGILSIKLEAVNSHEGNIVDQLLRPGSDGVIGAMNIVELCVFSTRTALI